MATNKNVLFTVRWNFKNIFEDFFASLFFYPCVAVQLDAASRDLIFDDDNKKLEIICRKDEAEAEADGNVNLAFKN